MNKKLKIRTLLIGIVFTLLYGVLVGRLYYVQIVEAADLVEKAEILWSQNETIPAVRGNIYDRNDKILAQDGEAYTVVVQPKVIHDRNLQDAVVDTLSPILDMSKEKLISLLNRKRDNGEFLAQVEVRSEGWKIDKDTADLVMQQVKEHDLKGVFLINEQKRYYPAKELASHILGYRDKDGEAVLGLERRYDDVLKGTPGQIKYDKDGKSFELPDSKVTYVPAVHGHSVRLTIDENIQLYMDRALAAAYEQYSPKSITAIAVDPNTMEILGMSNYPNFNPNEYWKFADDFSVFYNHAISSTYEPGSTFKIVTLAGAVEEGIFDPEDKFMSGRITVPGGVVLSDHQSQGWGEITYLDAVKRSSNVGFVKLGYEKLGAVKLKEYIDAFGFGQRTGIDLAGEAEGTINFDLNNPTETATATYGQGRVTVTSLQQIAAISAIANGGKLLKPYIVKDIIDEETNEVVESFGPTFIRQVISEKTSYEVGQYLEQVVSDLEIGTGRHVYSEEYRIAGKTGTAQKVIDGMGYADDRWIISFIGYAPVENPQIALLVTMDEPDLGGDYRLGGVSIAPIFKEIMTKSLRYIGVSSRTKEANVTISSMKSVVPDVIDYTPLGAENEIKKNGFDVAVLGHGQTVIKQHPEPGTELLPGQKVTILTANPEHIALPDFTGMSLRDAFEWCGLMDWECEYSGEGYVKEQVEAMRTDGTRVVKLYLEPRSLF